jgi:stearoyl-CoA desaturase (Delta-9 desaturase)
MPTDSSIALPPGARRDRGESRLPLPLRISVPWPLRRAVRINHVTLLLRVALAAELAGAIAGVWWFITRGIGWPEVAVFFLMFLVSGLGITVGYHRLFAHRSLRARPWVAAMLGIYGAMGMQGPILYWVSIHRKHHRYPDALEDPHSPRPRGEGPLAAARGAYHGFVGWILGGSFCLYSDYVKDLRRDPVIRFVDRLYPVWVLSGVVLPGLIGLAWYGTWQGFVACAFAGGPVRLFFTLTSAWYVNSVAHLFGSRSFATADTSRNSLLVNVTTIIGEGWHNNHHAFPRSANFGVQGAQFDLGYQFIRLLKRLGMVDRVLVASGRAIDMAETEEEMS